MMTKNGEIIDILSGDITASIDCHNGVKAMCSTGTDFTVPLNSIFTLILEDQFIDSSDCTVESIEISKDDTEELLTVTCRHAETGISIRVCVLQRQDESLSIILQLSDSIGVCRDRIYLHSPFLAGISGLNGRIYFPARPAVTDAQHEIFQQYGQALPLVITDMDDRYGFSFTFPVISDLEPAVQNRNVELSKIKSTDGLRHHRLAIRLSNVWSDQFEIIIRPLHDGWPQAFEINRAVWLSSLNLDEYERPDLQWINDLFLHHFTFVFSKESYDYQQGCIDLQRLITQGNEFGGYGTILLWHQYPRLGIDERTQWDFYNDFPGGLEGLSNIVQQAHDNGIKVLLPYKPWDVGADQVDLSTSARITEIVRKTQIDGFFLDTMSSPPTGLRQAADAARPGIVLFSEIHPSVNAALEMITASWDQYWNHDAMPEIDLVRFLLPAHHSPLIARWRDGKGKDMQIKRAMFNGTNMVIWQDIFGAWLPYSQEQKALIRQYKDVWMSNLHIFHGRHPIPLYPTFTRDLFCNMFIDMAEHEVIYSFYNASCQSISTDKIRPKGRTGSVCVLLGSGCADMKDNRMFISVDAGEVLMVKAVLM